VSHALPRVLIVHNAYQHRGGEDSVVDDEVKLLKKSGHTIEIYGRNNDEIANTGKFALAQQTLWSRQSSQQLATAIREFQPEVIHVHNTFPLISPSIYWTATRMGVPVIQTLHNFRLLCPQAVFLREGMVCQDCLGKVPWRGAARACYRASMLESTVLASMITFHRAIGTWKNKVTRYIALNEFCRNKFIEGGLPGGRIVIKPNFVEMVAPQERIRTGFLFVGRLSNEKGVDVLVGAAATAQTASIRVAGSGPESLRLAAVPNLLALGGVSAEVVRDEMSRATALVLPSICFESFPRSLVEAFASRLPVIASRLGPITELVKDGVTGLLFEPGNAIDLADKMRWAQQHSDEMAAMGRNARKQYEVEFTADRNYRQLMSIYADAIAEVKTKAP
jgi:glycosyltransferase involved in cell wall biosynthesis